ncbi:12280_t:CDS:1, partial [Entrophospora sp. SA101]
QDQGFDRERKGWEQERKKWSQTLDESNTAIQNLRAHDLELIAETKRLQIKNASKDISLASFKADNDINSKKIRSLESMIKILEGKLKSAQMDVLSVQNDSLKKDSKILSLKSKIAELENIKSELESKANELECLKSEAILKPIVGGNDEKNMTKSDDISAVLQSRPLDDESEIRGSVSSLNHDIYVSSEPSKDLSQYFLRGKNMDPIEKIDGNISTYTNDEITELPKIDTEISPKINEGTSISKTNNNILQEIPNITPHLAQPENYASSLIESNSQMRPSLEASPLPIGGIGAIPVMTSTLMSPLSAYICLILLIIAVMWFVRHTWGFDRKSERLRDAWTRY